MTHPGNETLKKELLNPDSLSALEQTLNDEAKELNTLSRRKKAKNLDRDKKIPEEELSKTLQKVASYVNQKLGMESNSLPEPEYKNFLHKRPDLAEDATILAGYAYLPAGIALAGYTALNSDPNLAFLFADAGLIGGMLGGFTHQQTKPKEFDLSSNKVYSDKAPRTKVIPDLAHAYTSYLQHKRGVNPLNTIFNDGQARFVQKDIAKKYSEKENNPAFRYHVLKTSVPECKSAYIWACHNQGEKPDGNVLREAETGNILNRVDVAYRARFNKQPTSHALGNAFFSVCNYNT